MRARSRAGLLVLSLGLGSCLGAGAVYPPRPQATPGRLTGDPTPSRVVMHLAVSSRALSQALDEAIPKGGEGAFSLLFRDRTYTWERSAFEASTAQGRIVVSTRARATIPMPIGSLEFPLEIRMLAEPVVTAELGVKLQAVAVEVTSSDKRLEIADHVAGIFRKIGRELESKASGFSYDLRPVAAEAHARMTKPMTFAVGDANACASVRVLGIEAGPTVLADGIEKDVALLVAPEVTMPCSANADERPALPVFSNVPSVPPGPFFVTIPIAASYSELAKSMGTVFTDGKYYFSQEFPELYLEHPEIYDSQGQIVLKVHLHGPIRKFGISTTLDGDIFFSGHLAVSDNDIQVPDLEPTIETSQFLLSLKAMSDGQRIRDQARAALRIDLTERLRSVRETLASQLTYSLPRGCAQGFVDKIELTSVHTHGTYLRAILSVTGRAHARMPCPSDERAP